MLKTERVYERSAEVTGKAIANVGRVGRMKAKKPANPKRITNEYDGKIL